MKRIGSAVALVTSVGVIALYGQQPALPRTDANGNPLRLATKTGHVSNYDESKVPPYTLPDPLVFGELPGKKDLGVSTLPPLETQIVTGDLGWHYHTGGHAATPADWQAFLTFVEKYFK